MTSPSQIAEIAGRPDLGDDLCTAVGTEIQRAWNADPDLPPIVLTEGEMRRLARAAISAIRIHDVRAHLEASDNDRG